MSLIVQERIRLDGERPKVIVKSIATAEGGRQIAFGEKVDAGFCVVRDDRDGSFFADVAGIRFSRDGQQTVVFRSPKKVIIRIGQR